MRVSVGVCAYNEDKNIGKLLSKLTLEPLVNDVVVVASGCTDNTVSIAMQYPVKLIVQGKREGKANAINQYLKYDRTNLQSDICVLESADTLPSDFTFKYLLAPFTDNRVGMVGCHPIPTNLPLTRIEKVGKLLWETHHYLALKHPKAGEVCAFRNVVESIDSKTAVDEAYIEHEIVKQGYYIVYAPHALVFNKSPETIEDFMKQRKRIYVGHLKLKDDGYLVKTMDVKSVIMATLKATKNPYLLGYAARLEYRARNLALKDYNNNTEYHIWNEIKTTKGLG